MSDASALARFSTKILLGRIAIEKGFLTAEHLEDAVREQVGGPSLTGTRTSRPLGVILVAKGYLTDKQLLEVLAEQKRRLQDLTAYAAARKEDSLFGQLVVRERLTTSEEVNAALRFQAVLAEQGCANIPRLGELLVERERLSMEDVRRLLELQSKTLLVCTFCGRQFNMVGYAAGKDYPCKKCGGTLVRPAALHTLKADETAFEFHTP